MYGQVQKHIPSMAFVHVNMFANSLCMQTRLLVCANAFGLVCESLSNMCALYIASGRYCKCDMAHSAYKVTWGYFE